MSQFERWIRTYRDHAQSREPGDGVMQELERKVMLELPSSQPSWVYRSAWALAAAVLIAFVSISRISNTDPQLLAEHSEAARVESVFYVENHMAIWLDLPADDPSDVKGDKQ